ncbi:hypothetical protein GLOTRDRAFT_133584 [Gloeophyllum trabeum ATCC 11539]|uniref:Septin-type G domain-containing protein n=1 Tax=Gloeophyllum trabeum (strain ATCC 11539 / FP-39264 / Madison 617) TaxID=670483 RepID=S7R970_GLOTA|nr:uncharacterized protein GLOTRDRAFT_133584 [Gloeophyllum trabeum ATCC 11539]EPQ50840.1 hypothetical protein GLOTRDRAFT_133584 [Gloeophyllum trabeum ATCC 11539]
MSNDAQPTMSTSAGTIRGLHMPPLDVATSAAHSPSTPPSPTDSVSSFPSVSSSFFFSSGPASPPLHPDTDPDVTHTDDHEHEAEDSTSALIIPSLTLPSALRRPTLYGQVLGELRVLVLGRHGVRKSRVAEALLEGNEDLVDVDEPEEEEARGWRTRVWRASSEWVELRDAHGLERVEPRRNVEVVMWPGYDPAGDDPEAITAPIVKHLQSSFHALHALIDPAAPSSSTPLLTSLVGGPNTPLWTLGVLVADKDGALTPLDRAILAALSPYIPLIVLPAPSAPAAYPIPAPSFHDTHTHIHAPSPAPSSSSLPSESQRRPPIRPASRSRTETVTLPTRDRWKDAHSSTRSSREKGLSAFRPPSVLALRSALFRSPETLALLRGEAGERWVRWRASVSPSAAASPRSNRGRGRGRGQGQGWDKRRWEEELAYSQAQTQTQTYTEKGGEREEGRCAEAMGLGMDPLHVPSLFAVAVGLFRGEGGTGGSGVGWGWLVVAAAAAFCAGVGVGWGLLRM